MTSTLWREAHTTIHFVDGSRVEVPKGDTLRVQEGWVSVTTRVNMPHHHLAKRGQGLVEQTNTWPSSAIARVESIREVDRD